MLDYVDGVNAASDSILAIFILFLIWVIAFIAMKQYDTKAVFLASSLLVSFVGVIFLALGWVTFAIIIVPMVMSMFSFIALVFSQS
jgi:hypothetical protein